MGIVKDITAHKHMEADVQRSHSTLDNHVQQHTAEQATTTKAVEEEIMERKRVEESLRESEERYRTLVETLPSALLLTDLDGTIHFGNRQAALLFGYDTVEDLYGKNGAELIALDPYPDFSEYVAGIISNNSGKKSCLEHTMRKRDGTLFPAEVNSSLITDSQGEASALIIVVQDISQRKESEQAITAAYQNLSDLTNHISRSRSLLHAIVDGLEDGLLLLDRNGYVQTINRALVTLLGTNPETLIGQKWATIYPRLAPTFPGDFALAALAANTSENTHQHSLDHRYKDPAGNTHILNLHTIALQDSRLTTEHVIFHVVDVTEYVKLQNQVMENDRFATSGRLAASVAHEMNTPLQSIQLFVELAQVASDEKRPVFLSYITEEIQRIGRIVHNMLELYRPGALSLAPLAVNTLIERLLLLVGKRFMEQRVIVQRDLEEDLPMVWGRADEIMQVLLNLFINALDAMSKGGTLSIRTQSIHYDRHDHHYPLDKPSAPDTANTTTNAVENSAYGKEHTRPECFQEESVTTYVMIEITDNGCGISPDIQDRIFDAFMTTKQQGTGLGLAISKQFIQRFGGTISVESKLHKGSTFLITLPVRKPEESLPETEEEETR
jgi:PAS domain S-box-containing protein